MFFFVNAYNHICEQFASTQKLEHRKFLALQKIFVREIDTQKFFYVCRLQII